MRTGPWTLVAASLGFGVVQLDVTAVNVAVEPIGRALGGGVAGGQWVVNAYTVAFAALILTAGALGDRIGARRLFAGGSVLFTLASVACGLAPGLGALVAARAVQGVGAAVLVPCSLSLVAHAHPTPASRARGLDLPGQLAAVTALAAPAGATILAGVAGFGAPPVLGRYGLAVLAATAFVVAESRSTALMLPLGLFRRPVFASASAIGVLANIAFSGLIFVLGLYLQQADAAEQRRRHGGVRSGRSPPGTWRRPACTRRWGSRSASPWPSGWSACAWRAADARPCAVSGVPAPPPRRRQAQTTRLSR